MHPCPAYKCRGWDNQPTLTDQPMCDHHTGRVTHVLGKLPQLYQAAGQAMPDTTSSPDDTGTAHTKAEAAPVPINLQARALQDDMLTVTREADDAVRRHAKLSPAPRRHPHHPHGVELATLTVRSKMLAAHTATMLELDTYYGIELLRINHAVNTLLGLTRLVHRLNVPCPHCDTIAVVRDNGSSWVRCEHCNATFNEENYGLLVRMVADQLPAQPTRPQHATIPSARDGYGW